VRSAPFFGLVMVAAALSATAACQFNYDLVSGADDLGGMAGSTTDSGTGGATPSGGGTNSLGGSSAGGSDLGGADSGGSDSGGADTGGSDTGGSDTGGSGGSGGASGGSGGASGGSGGSSGGTGGVSTSIVVTTTSDEQDSNATPASPGGNGFSLREAILYANQNPDHFDITFNSSGMSINLSSPLPTITKTAYILGNNTSIQGAGAGTSAPCVAVSGADVVLEKLWIFACPAAPVAFLPGSGPGNQFYNGYVADNDAPALIDGDSPTVVYNYWASSDASSVIDVVAPNADILANQIVDPAGAGIYLRDTADGAYVLANCVINANPGIDSRALDGATFWHNTVVDGPGDGVSLTGTTNVDFRNNIVSGNNVFGVDASGVTFTFFNYNLYYDNTSGNANGAALGANDLTGNPLFTNPGADDYTLQTGSPAIDSAFDTGDDRTPATAGNYNGAGPDRGFVEK
jgi:CSLREA domain-containing protein